jgi:NAD(P)-dependent dehydrogenase (short-subunit alcohol dehydrogenase family)
MKMKDFKGKKAYITGGSSGIGLAIARLLASRGASVVIFARRQGVLEDALKQIEVRRIEASQVFLARQLDVADREACERVLAGAVAEFGIPDILINSAGLGHPAVFEDIDYGTFDRLIRINVHGTWNTLSLLVPHMKAGGGYIVNVSSVAGYIGVYGMAAYSSSKFGVNGLSEVLRSELKRFNISVSVLCPPDVDTPLLERSNRIKPEETKAISATASLMSADEVAAALLKGMAREEFMIIPNFGGRFTYVMKRLFPGLVSHIVDSKVAAVRKKQASR